MPDLGALGATAAIAAVAGWASNFTVQWLKSGGDRSTAQIQANVDARHHVDEFSIKMLEVAQEEMAAWRAEAKSLRPLLIHEAHIHEALDHLHRLLHAQGEHERAAAERMARAFYRKMRPETGDLRNEEQKRRIAGDDEYPDDDHLGEKVIKLGPKPPTQP